MKFFDPEITGIGVNMRQMENGGYATRADAEQAAKDAVDLANAILGYNSRLELIAKAQAIIERYEGGKGNDKL